MSSQFIPPELLPSLSNPIVQSFFKRLQGLKYIKRNGTYGRTLKIRYTGHPLGFDVAELPTGLYTFSQFFPLWFNEENWNETRQRC